MVTVSVEERVISSIGDLHATSASNLRWILRPFRINECRPALQRPDVAIDVAIDPSLDDPRRGCRIPTAA